MLKIRFIILIFCSLHITLFCQVKLNNASFEGKPADATTPQSWLPCEEGTTPDILPGPWAVYHTAIHGKTYVGLIVRQDGSFESIGQRLRTKITKNECHTLTLYLSHSDTYAGHKQAIRLRIYGSQVACQDKQLLHTTSVINHKDWREYSIEFTPTEDMQYLILEACPADKKIETKGNILIDYISEIRKCKRA